MQQQWGFTIFAAVVPIEAALVDVGDAAPRRAVKQQALVVSRAVHHVHYLATLSVLPVKARVLDPLHLRHDDRLNGELLYQWTLLQANYQFFEQIASVAQDLQDMILRRIKDFGRTDGPWRDRTVTSHS